MRIRIWNAFASNNSGSYTIVGKFPTPELASDVAAQLTTLVQAHEHWRQDESANDDASPLSLFANQYRLTSDDEVEIDESWPEYNDDVPQVFAIGHQVVIHHDYTLGLPRMFGHYFYVRGGRVEHEINHAHGPIVAVFSIWSATEERNNIDVKAKVDSIIEDLTGLGGPLETGCGKSNVAPVWRPSRQFGEVDLTVGAVFDDLLTGFSAVEKIAKVHGMKMVVKLFESTDGADPLASLRTND
jgi:hypothetical protein